MTISKSSAPPRARISSTARAPAIPFPMTTSRCLLMGVPPLRQASKESDRSSVGLEKADVEHHCAGHALRGGDQHGEFAFGEDVFHDRQWDVNAGLGADREI